jgi:DNA repair protein RadC
MVWAAFVSPQTKRGNMQHPIVTQALKHLACEVSNTSALSSPQAVKYFLQLKLADKPHEVFAVLFLDAQHRMIEFSEMFRGTLTQTSVYPR